MGQKKEGPIIKNLENSVFHVNIKHGVGFYNDQKKKYVYDFPLKIGNADKWDTR